MFLGVWFAVTVESVQCSKCGSSNRVFKPTRRVVMVLLAGCDENGNKAGSVSLMGRCERSCANVVLSNSEGELCAQYCGQNVVCGSAT